MDPQTAFCPNLACNAHGEVGSNTIRVPSWTERRYRCNPCGRTFAATTHAVQRLRTEAVLILVVSAEAGAEGELVRAVEDAGPARVPSGAQITP